MKLLHFLPLLAWVAPAFAGGIAYDDVSPPHPLVQKFAQDYLADMQDLVYRVETDQGLNWTHVAIELSHWRNRARANAKIWRAAVSSKAALAASTSTSSTQSPTTTTAATTSPGVTLNQDIQQTSTNTQAAQATTTGTGTNSILETSIGIWDTYGVGTLPGTTSSTVPTSPIINQGIQQTSTATTPPAAPTTGAGTSTSTTNSILETSIGISDTYGMTTTSASASPTTSTSATSTTASAPSSTATAGAEDTADESLFLSLHNNFRQQYGANPVIWNDTLAQYAYKAASSCKYGHTDGPYGENIAAGVGGGYDVTIGFGSWSSEYKLYNWNQPGYSDATGHFTQIVWKATTQIGCAAYSCPDGTIFTGYGANSTYLVCEYAEPGNWVDPSSASATASYFTENVGTAV